MGLLNRRELIQKEIEAKKSKLSDQYVMTEGNNEESQLLQNKLYQNRKKEQPATKMDEKRQAGSHNQQIREDPDFETESEEES